MDFTLSLSSDWFNLVSIPLILLTLKDVIPKWKSIWDDNVTTEDRRLMMRMVIFLALPVVVFIHESGHLLAALQVGAKVYEFHYGPVTGHVNVDSNQPPESLLWIAIAGNLAQIVLGIICLVAATIVRHAAAIVFLVYLGLFSIGDTVIFYAALSLASIYGDWENIYTSPCHNLVMQVGIVHGALVAFIVYCVAASGPRRWFTEKTMPGWSARQKKLSAQVKEDPSLENYIGLASNYIEAGLFKDALSCIQKAESISPGSPALVYAKADLEMARGNMDKSLVLYEELAQDERVSTTMRAQVILQMGDIWLYRRNVVEAMQCFEAASHMDPLQGDARLQKMMLMGSSKSYEGLEEDLVQLKDPETQWIYKRNRDSALKEIERLEEMLSREK